MESHFEYQPLQTGEIRLVRLKLAPNAKDFPLGGGPSRESELLYAPIECEIANYSLGNCPPFIALSYTWNTDEDQREIKLNGHPWIVRRNLARFLRHARDDLELYNSPSILSRVGKALKGLNKLLANGAYVRRPKQETIQSSPQDQFSPLGYLWIDALCIDQKSIPERNSQVAIMRDIYKSSQRIIIWLGLACTCHFYRAMDAYTYYVSRYRDKYRSHDRSGFFPSMVGIPDEVIEAIECLSSREWWTRSWIVQEASTPDVPKEVWCGHKRVSWEALEFVQALLWDIAAERQAMIPPGRNECLEYLNRLAEARKGDTTASLLDLLVEGRKFEATDPRDKIYAFLGIHADSHGTAPLSVDYLLPVSKVYHQMAIHILETSDNLNLLLNCGSFRKQATPTWVPDWSVSGGHHDVLRKNGNASGDRTRQLTFEDDKKALVVRGVHWDIVTEIVPHLVLPTVEIPPEDLTDFVLNSSYFLEWVRAIAKLAYRDGKDGPYPVACLSIKGALNLLFQLLPLPVSVLYPEPLGLCNLPFLEVLNGGKIGSMIYHAPVGAHIVHRRVTSLCVFRTKRGYLGFGDEAVAPGDAVTILHGLGSPVILRRKAAAWQLLGPCFGVGIMLDEGSRQNPSEEDFRIE